ncbi:unnamed protein product [Linum trigynum]|uniref:O-methyltransferase C-terminal domain-containing protein n=1 Tax=Linum trigynum TaxID=586398 RepID=A0AAV2DGM9_9ROSI
MRAWPLVHEAVVDPTTEPFAKANGEPAYSYYGKQPEMNELMQKAMSGVSVPFMRSMLDGGGYDGFDGVRRLVDVGGSGGDCLRMILRKHPNVLEAINFDLPEVVAKAAPIPGVTHVGGDMFNSIPNGDAIFMKWILTTWTDEECKAIMANCYKALPEGGKLIACEPMLPKDSDDSHRTRALLELGRGHIRDDNLQGQREAQDRGRVQAAWPARWVLQFQGVALCGLLPHRVRVPEIIVGEYCERTVS